MARKRRAHDPVGQIGLRLLQGDARTRESGLPRFDLAGRQRPRILDPAIAGEQLIGLAHLDPRGLDRQPLGPRIKLDQRCPVAHEIACREQHPRHAPGGFGIDFRRRRRAGRTDRFNLKRFGKNSDILRHHRHGIARRLRLFTGTRGKRGKAEQGECARDRDRHTQALTDNYERAKTRSERISRKPRGK